MDSGSRPSSPVGSQLRVRKRASTKVLLGSDYVEDPTQAIDPPKPLQNASDYDADRIKQSLRYADCTLRNQQRRLLPLGTRALKLYEGGVRSFA